jgi:hypothetical protein
MEKTIRIFAFIYFAAIGVISCDSAPEAEPETVLVHNVGFTGKMPDDTDFGVQANLAANGVTGGGSSSQPYRGTHVISIRNGESSWTISVELPRVEFVNKPPMGESIDRGEYYTFFTEEYPYELVREKLLQERDKATSDPSYSSIESFRLQLTNQTTYVAFLHDSFTADQAGKLRIVEVIEGTEKNEQGDDVRKIEFIIDLELNLKNHEASGTPPTFLLKGQARLKYREDFHDKEFEQL